MNKTDLAVMEWFQSRDTGISSKAIAYHMIGADVVDRSHPLDPSDFGRCLRLIRDFPEWRRRLPEMKDLSPKWKITVENWEEIKASMVEEVGIDWEKGRAAPKTYELMKELGL